MSDTERRVRDAETLVRLETKLDGLTEKVDNSITYQHSLSDRVRALEFFKHAVLAVVGFVVTVAGYFKFTGGSN